VDSVERQISNAIKDGSLNKFLAQPVDFALYNLMTFLADSTPVLLGGIIVYGMMLFTGFVSATAFQIFSGVLVLLFGLFISFLLAFMIAALAFYMDEVWTLFVMKNMSMWFLTGQVIPLDMFPESVSPLLKFLPFGYLAFVPTKILTGTFSTEEILFALLIVFCWTLGLYLLYKIFWTYSLRRYSAFGG
jgi:ABC-2 type transport system permease protein